MWSAGADVIDLYLGGRQVAACAGSRVLARVEVQAWVQGPAVATELLREAGRRRAVRVWLGAGVCRPFLVPAAAAGLAWADRARLLQGLARRTLGGEVGDCTLWVERGPAGGDGSHGGRGQGRRRRHGRPTLRPSRRRDQVTSR